MNATALNMVNANRSASNFQLNAVAALGFNSSCAVRQSNIVSGSQIGVGNNR